MFPPEFFDTFLGNAIPSCKRSHKSLRKTRLTQCRFLTINRIRLTQCQSHFLLAPLYEDSAHTVPMFHDNLTFVMILRQFEVLLMTYDSLR